MKITILSLLLLAPITFAAEDIGKIAKITELWKPVPPLVTTGMAGSAPSDAIVLFNGTDLSAWESLEGGEALWRIDQNSAVTVVARAGDIRTRKSFADIQLHIEWRTPDIASGDGQGRGNSGIFLMERYEVQILDSFNNRTYSNGQAASVYKQHIPLVNASKGPGEWQAYDIIFTAPRFGRNKRAIHPATLTVLHNGVVVQNHVTIQGPTRFVGVSDYDVHGKAPLRLQNHGNPVSYRNIWVRELD